jgi:hypothetical protein
MTALAWLKLGAGAAVAIVWSWFCYHQGGLACQVKTSNAVAKEEATQLHQDQADAKAIASEGTTYAQVLDTNPVDPPHVSLCYYSTGASAPVPRPAPAVPGPAHAAELPAPAQHVADPTPGPDIGPDLEQLARQADAQVKGLEDYIEKVCRPGASP